MQLFRSYRVTLCLPCLITLHRAVERSLINLQSLRLYSRTSRVGDCSQSVTSASLQPNQGIQVQSSHPVAPAFLRLAPPDPFASSFGFSHPRNNSQNFTDASQNCPAAFDSQIPPALSVSANCSPIPHYIVDWVIAGQFVDFTLLLPSNIDKLPKNSPSQQNLSRIIRTEMTAIRIFGDWTEAWAVYLGIFAKKSSQ